jgi:adenosylcobinamide-GDP ribazoletransferase
VSPTPAAEPRAALAAVAFLTRVPVGRLARLDVADVARAGLWFPLVGLGIGAAVGWTASLLDGSLGPLLAAALAVALGAALTGALHLDALADTADALGGWSREQALEIMRDHRIGAYGATALGLDLLVKVAAVASLTDRPALVAAAGAVSRAVPPALGAVLPYARGGASFADAPRWRALVAAALATAAALWLGAAWLLVPAAAGFVAAAVVYRRWLGGVTGDALGAATELVETAALVVAVAACA